MEFSRQEYWSGLPFPSPVDLPNPGIEPRSPALQADSGFNPWIGKICWRKDRLPIPILSGFPWVAQRVKHLPAMQKTRVSSLGQEDPLEKEMATHSSSLAWKIPRMEEPDRLQSMGSQTIEHN